jgi:hypothetical protein
MRFEVRKRVGWAEFCTKRLADRQLDLFEALGKNSQPLLGASYVLASGRMAKRASR